MKRIYFFMMAALLMLTACNQTLEEDLEYEAIKSELEVSNTELEYQGEAQRQDIQITCNGYWTVESKTSWLNLSKSNGKGDGTLTVSVEANPSSVARRSGSITISDGIRTIQVNISQAPRKETLSASVTSLDFPFDGGTEYVTITSNTDWKASSDVSWCTVDCSSTRVTVRTSSNISYSPRSHIVIVTGGSASVNIHVNQKGVSEPAVDVLSVTNITTTSASCSFYFSSDDITVTRSGVCYSSTIKDPTTDNDVLYSTTSSYGRTSSFTLSGLKANTTYYARPYVTTSIGTTYGKVVSFTTINNNTNKPNEGDNPTPDY